MRDEPWSDQDVQRIHDVYHGLWRDQPAPEEFEDFLGQVKGRVRAPLVDAAIRRVKHKQTGENFRPSCGVFLAELDADLPSPTTVVPTRDDQCHDPRDLLQQTLEGTPHAWLRELINEKRRSENKSICVGSSPESSSPSTST